MKIERANHVWATDITYIPMACGWVYLCAIVDWASRKVLAHRVSISMDTAFCLEALEEAFAKYGQPEIFNTDQGSQFTSEAFTQVLTARGIQISMDGKGSWRDNVFVEHLRLTPCSAARSVIDSERANARTARSRRSLSGSLAATLPDRFMLTPELKNGRKYRPWHPSSSSGV
jgi:transposase InsO family protein